MVFFAPLRVDGSPDWGSVPSFTEDGIPIFTGIAGGIVYDNYDLSLSIW